MSTIEEVKQQLKKAKQELRDTRKEIEELRIREKFYQDRLEIAHEKNSILREEKRNMTFADVTEMQKARAEYVEKYQKDKEISEAFDKQSQVKLDTLGVNNE